jgi:hypothetical protein
MGASRRPRRYRFLVVFFFFFAAFFLAMAGVTSFHVLHSMIGEKMSQ